MTLPNFLIIGAQKGGTSALYDALKLHPQIWMSPGKEPAFFAATDGVPAFDGPPYRTRWITDLDVYEALFAGGAQARAIGEASTLYSFWHTDQTAAAIQNYAPDMRLLAILRQPAERAYSAFHFVRQQGMEPLADFQEALRAEKSRGRWHPTFRYAQNGKYSIHLKPYFERFPRAQIRIYLYEDWNNDPEGVIRDICRFLEIDEMFIPAMAARRNVTRITRSEALKIFLKRPHPLKALLRPLLPARWRKNMVKQMHRWNESPLPPLNPALRRELTESYRKDILKLQDLIGRNLSHWL